MSLKIGTILIIDDDQELVEEIKEILTEEGYSVTTAFDGKTGLNLFNTLNPDLVMLDMKLPEMTGMELLPLFKTMKPKIPVLMISGRPVFTPLTKLNVGEGNREEEILKIADGFMNKPFNIEQLLATIKKIVSAK
ncbi:MAG: response regulator [Candidatus Margulisbacteria bacterium]|nr:response regulator [Candidatus Margulisiibacteriota bacterium]